MARFPKTEPKIAQLARQIADGLEHAADEFPSPTVPAAVLRAQLEDYRELLHDQPRGVELKFRVLAMNRADVGGPSTTIRAVL